MGDRRNDLEHDGRDPLEAELEAFDPAPMSAGLAARIGNELRPRRGQLPWGHRRLLAGLGAAACVVAALYLWRVAEPRAPRDGGIALTRPAEPPPPPTPAAPLPPPSLAAYQRALAQSPDALDSLLDAHAPRLFPAAGPSPAGVFHSSRARLCTTNGETL